MNWLPAKSSVWNSLYSVACALSCSSSLSSHFPSSDGVNGAGLQSESRDGVPRQAL